MSSNLTRRDFLGNAAVMAGAAPALRFDRWSLHPHPIADSRLERRSSFDPQWKFFKGDPAEAHSPSFDDSTWSVLDVPHDWSIEGPFSQAAPAGGAGAYLPTGIGWYRKQFTLPRTTAGKRVSLQFDGVYQRSEVWINGTSLGMRPYGFITFAYDLTPHLKGHGKPNQIAVRVDNSLQPNCRWYSGSGIYRHTWLIVTEPVHVAMWGITVRTPSISSESADVEVTTRIQNEGDKDASCDLTIEILDRNGTVMQQSTSPQSIARGSENNNFVQILKVTKPDLWSTGNPHLYTARCTLHSGEQQLDQETTTFGIREIKFDVDRGFLLNGESVKLNGVCIHGDAGSVGTAVPERVWERRLELLREMGCNAIRLSHNPPAPELLDMLDKMGFLVMDEAFDEWKRPKGQTSLYGYHKYFDEWSARDLSAMLERDRNHPSIVLWSAGNEVPDQTDPHGPETLKALKDIIRQKDPTRLVTVACDQIASQPKAAPPQFLEELDVVGYNYVDRWRDRREKYYSIDRHDYPNRRFIGTESAALSGARGMYAMDQANGLFERASNAQIEVEQQQKFIHTYDYVSGDFLWTGIDYLGESRWPSKLAATGALDTCGFKKDSFYFYQSVWTDEPVLHLSPHWNWPGKEGQVIPVVCYTNCDTVELFLNGKSFGLKGYAFPRPGMVGRYGNYPPRARALQTTADLHLSWDVPYETGTLTAVGRKNGEVVRTVDVQTTGVPVKLALAADRQSILASPSDVAHITVQITDAAGRVVPTADDDIAFSIRGEGRILGVDNGQPDSHESYKASQRKTFNGMALVILQATGRSGTMTLSASAPDRSPAQITIDVT